MHTSMASKRLGLLTCLSLHLLLVSFLSHVDTLVDKLLEKIGMPEALDLMWKVNHNNVFQGSNYLVTFFWLQLLKPHLRMYKLYQEPFDGKVPGSRDCCEHRPVSRILPILTHFLLILSLAQIR